MKRDLDLIRKILFRTEEIPPDDHNINNLDFEGYDEATVSAHALLMYEAGLIEASFTRTPRGTSNLYSLRRLLGPGHDMLDTIRNDTVWAKTKDRVSTTVGSTTLEIVKGIAEGVAKGMIGM